jgi:hypothetical protein
MLKSLDADKEVTEALQDGRFETPMPDTKARAAQDGSCIT